MTDGGDATEPVCPFCGADDVELESAFGLSLMTTLYRCHGCGGHFEAVKWG